MVFIPLQWGFIPCMCGWRFQTAYLTFLWPEVVRILINNHSCTSYTWELCSADRSGNFNYWWGLVLVLHFMRYSWMWRMVEPRIIIILWPINRYSSGRRLPPPHHHPPLPTSSSSSFSIAWMKDCYSSLCWLCLASSDKNTTDKACVPICLYNRSSGFISSTQPLNSMIF